MSVISRGDIRKFDTLLFDSSSTGSGGGGSSADDVTFNGYNMQNANVRTSLAVHSGPVRALNKRRFPRANGSYAETDFWSETKLTLRGSLSYSTRALLEAGMDTFRKNLAVAGGILKIPFAGGFRYWECYATSMETMFSKRTGQMLTWTPWEIDFVCLHPFSRDLSRISYDVPSAITASPTTVQISHSGSAVTEDIIYIVFGTAGTASAFTISNSTTGEAITVTSSITDADVFTLDGENKQVLKNGSAVDYTGVFPRLASGTNSLVVTVTGSGFSIAMTETHYNRYF